METIGVGRNRVVVGVVLASLLVAGCASAPVTSAPTVSAPPATEPAPVAGSSSGTAAPSPPGTAGASPGASAIGQDTAFPELGDRRLDVLHYDLALAFDPDDPVLRGHERLDAQVTTQTDEVALDLRGLRVSGVRVDGRSVESRDDERKVTIPLGGARRPGDTFVIDIDYAGTPEPVPTAALGGVEVGWHSQERGSFVLAEPEGASTWFAANNHPLDKATYAFHVEVPRPYVAIANGSLDRTEDGDHERTYHWSMDRPMASYLAVVVTGDFAPSDGREIDGIAYENWLPESLRDPSMLDAPLDAAEQASTVGMLADKLGPFPFATYGAIVYPRSFTPGADRTDAFMSRVALETQGRSLYAEASLEAETLTHETAHQWFGDSVSITDWRRDIWWVEGFATFAESIPELDADPASWDAAWAARFAKARPAWRPPGELATDDMFQWSYTGGSLVFWALWREVGDETFWQIMQSFQQRYRYANASTEDLIALSSELAGRDLRPFFDEWLFETGTPTPPPPPPR